MIRGRLIRTQLNMLVLAVAVPLVAILAYAISEDIRHDQQQAAEKVSLLAHNLAHGVLAATSNVKVLLAQAVERSGMVTPDPRHCSAGVEFLLQLHPLFLATFLGDRDGNLVCARCRAQCRSLGNAAIVGAELRDLALATDHMPGLMAVGNKLYPVQRYALLDEQGRVSGSLNLVADAASYAQTLDMSRLPPGTTAEIRTATGALILRVPAPALSGVATTDSLPAALSKSFGERVATGNDGVSRLYGDAAIGNTGWRAIVGIPTGAILAPGHDQAMRNSVLALLVVASVAVVAWTLARHISRPVQRIADAARCVAAGCQEVPVEVSGPREIRDVAEQFNAMQDARRKSDELLRISREHLQALSRRLMAVEESERMQIARELHDEIGQALTALTLHLDAARRNVANDAVDAKLAECGRITERTLQQVRSLCLDLRPPQLDDLGLVAALRWQIDRQASAAGLTVNFACEIEQRHIDPAVSTVCFRVAQEAMTNVVRHADARTVWVLLDQREGELLLVVRDDGKGFDFAVERERAMRGGSIGLLSMEERVMLAGGRLEIVRVAQGGTEVRASFPQGGTDAAPGGITEED